MSIVLTDPALHRTTFVRGFEMPLSDGWDGRTLDVRIVPYNTPAMVADPPDFRPYREMFVPGVFTRQLTTPGRDKVWLNVEHEEGFAGAVGFSLGFSDHEDGLHGSFGVDPGDAGDKALRMVTSGFLAGLSLEFKALTSRRIDGVIQRVRAHLDTVSLCRYPAYQDAQVLALREEPEGVEPDELEPEELEELGTPPARAPELVRSGAVDELLAAVAFDPLVRAGVTENAWDGSPGRFTDEQYQRSALICRPGGDPLKERCLLPVLEPDGAINLGAVARATAALAGAHRPPLASVTREQKAAAARKLIRYCNDAGRDVPPSLRQVAQSA